MSDKKRTPHPSGRPIKRDEFRRLSIQRIELAQAIGFHLPRANDEDDE